MSKTIKTPKIKKQTLDAIEKNHKKYAETASIKDLTSTLRALSWYYYNTDESLVSDKVFDDMKDILQERDPKNEFLAEVGAPVETVEKIQVKLPYPMGSLSKIKPDKDNLDAWIKKYKGPFLASDKLDGVSSLYIKKSDNVFELYTRGDGVVGTDITPLIKYVIPKEVKTDDIPVGTAIRGELIISRDDFKTIAAKMKNGRNAVAGLANSKTIDPSIAKLTQFIAYSISHPSFKISEQFRLLEQYGFKTAFHKSVKKLDYKMLTDLLIDRRKNSPFEVDGVVVMDDSKPYELIPGNPDYAFAFKTLLADQTADSKVVKVIWNPSKDGYLKPSIEIEPVELGGTTITHATAFNAKFVLDNKIAPGAIVKIVRAGDVIPNILAVVKPAADAEMPDTPYKWTPTNVDIIMTDIYTQNDAVMTKVIANFFEKLQVKHISEGIISKFVQAGYKSVLDILSADKEDLTQIEGIGSKTVDTLMNGTKEALKNTDLATLMAGSNCFGRAMGVTRLSEITETYPNIMTVKWDEDEIIEKVSDIKGFSDTTARQFAEGLPAFKKFFNDLNEIIDVTHLKKKPENLEEPNKQVKAELCDGLLDLKIVFTGFRDKQLEKRVKDCDGKVLTSVSKNADVVVAADATGDSSKLVTARKLGITVLSKDEFIKKYKLNT